MSYLELLPAVDVKDGRAVRLVQGELAAETAYGNPLEVALEFQAAGAEWLHLVDLDAAFGRGENSALLAEVVGKLDIKVELSGGIRDDESLKRALATGCRRVNLGTAALENPEWTAQVIGEYGDRIAVGLDVRGHVLAARGWTLRLFPCCSGPCLGLAQVHDFQFHRVLPAYDKSIIKKHLDVAVRARAPPSGR